MILRKRLNSNGNCKYLNKSEQKGENIFSPLKLYFFFCRKAFYTVDSEMFPRT